MGRKDQFVPQVENADTPLALSKSASGLRSKSHIDETVNVLVAQVRKQGFIDKDTSPENEAMFRDLIALELTRALGLDKKNPAGRELIRYFQGRTSRFVNTHSFAGLAKTARVISYTYLGVEVPDEALSDIQATLEGNTNSLVQSQKTN